MKKLLTLLLSLSLVLCCACGIGPNTVIVEPSETAFEETSETVYVTKTGSKYHSYGCTYLKQSCIPRDLSKAELQGYTPCSKCH